MGDAVFDFLNSGGSGGKAAPASAPAADPSGKPSASNDAVFDFLNSGGSKTVAAKVAATPGKVVDTPQNTEDPVLGTAAHVATGIGSSIVGGLKGVGELMTGGTMDDAANAVTQYQQDHTYQPEAGSGAEKGVQAFESPFNPLNWVPIASKKLGEFSQEHLGASPGIATGIEVAGNVVGPAALLKGARAVGGTTVERLPPPRFEPGTLPAESVAPSVQISDVRARASAAVEAYQKAAADANVPMAQVKQLGEQARAATQAYKDFNDQSAAAPGKAVAAEPVGKPLALEPAEPRAQTPEAPKPQSPALAVEPAAGASRDRMATSAEAGEETPKFLEQAPETGAPKGPETDARRSILQRVGVDEVRKSAIVGDSQAAADEFQSSKLNNPYGAHMRDVLDKEKAALSNYSEGLVRDTGGTVGSTADTGLQYSRGDTIIKPLQDLNEYFNKATKKLYEEADKRAAGNPVALPEVHKLISGDQADFLGTTEGEALLRGMKARMKSLGMLDAEGNPLPVTVERAERLKQYLGQQWKPGTSRLISAVKDAIDDDVLKGAGEDVYKEARRMRALKGSVFENDLTDTKGRTFGNGVAKLIDANGKTIEFKSGVTPENFANRVTSLSTDQLRHVVEVMKNLPEELAPRGQEALSEIKAQFANKIHDIGTAQTGQWAAKNVSKYLNQNAARLQQVFTPEEINKFNDLNDAGHILAKDQSYPGAAVQEHNLMERGAMTTLKGAGAATGAAAGALIGMPGTGAAVGGYLGDLGAKALGERGSLKAAQKRTTRLGDFK